MTLISKNKPKAIFCWSGGKDSAMALHKVLQEDECEVVALLTTLSQEFKRVSMHGVREELLDEQAKSIGLKLIKMYVSDNSNATYEKEMQAILLENKLKGVTKVIFGDIFLEDLRAYREQKLKPLDLEAIFPLWMTNTQELINDFFTLGFKTITCCVNDAYFNEEAVGVEITNEFIKNLPTNVDPCGENGEYHTFCYSGPIFKKKVNFSMGNKLFRPLEIKNTQPTNSGVCNSNNQTTGFWFCELIKN
ncbi:MAG: diphthine--ammonia ligase [Bacteroidia bacterium]